MSNIDEKLASIPTSPLLAERMTKEQPSCENDPKIAGCSDDTISRQAVIALDRFTKIFCRDKSVKDDLVFRCEICEFEMPGGYCLVKRMARNLCPDYKDFGSMGDL